MAKFFGRHLALAWFPIADSNKEKPQQIGLSGSALAFSRRNQRSECINIALVDKACGRIDI